MFGLFKKTWRKRIDALSEEALEQELADIVADALGELDRVSAVRVTGPMSLAGTADGVEHQLFLYNLLPQLRGAESGTRTHHVERFVASMAEARSDPALRDLVPVLKSASWVNEARAMATQQSRPDMVAANQVGSIPFAGDVHVVFAFDAPSSMSFATAGALHELGVAADASLLEKAKAVLRERLPPVELQRGPASCMVTCGGTFEASAILFDDVVQQVRALFEGDLVALVPARDVLLFTGTRTPGGLEEILSAGRSIHENQGNYLLSLQPLVRGADGAWTEYIAA